MSGPMRLRDTFTVTLSAEHSFDIIQNKSMSSATGWLVWPVAVEFCEYIFRNQWLIHGKSVIELGSGTGLVGIVCSSMCSKLTVMSDPSEDLPICMDNMRLNAKFLRSPEGVHVKELYWGNLTHLQTLKNEFGLFDVIVGTDVVYHQGIEVLTALVETIVSLSHTGTEVLIAYEDREGMIEDEPYFFGPLRARFSSLSLIDLGNNRIIYHYKDFNG